MHCWICDAPALSGEHLVKDSMLRDLFGKVTQAKPLFLRRGEREKRRLQSTDAKAVKLRVLCERCNSATTQPFDRSWDVLWTYLQNHRRSLRTGDFIRQGRVYPFRSRQRMLELHLYVVKLFGCVAANFSIPVDLAGMADAIKQRRPYPHVYLGIGKRTWLPQLKLAGPTDVNALNDADTGRCAFAVWFLTVDAWEFQFIYAVQGEMREGLRDVWNPVATPYARKIRLKQFAPPAG